MRSIHKYVLEDFLKFVLRIIFMVLIVFAFWLYIDMVNRINCVEKLDFKDVDNYVYKTQKAKLITIRKWRSEITYILFYRADTLVKLIHNFHPCSCKNGRDLIEKMEESGVYIVYNNYNNKNKIIAIYSKTQFRMYQKIFPDSAKKINQEYLCGD